MASKAQIKNRINSIKNTMVANLNIKGRNTTSDMTFDNLNAEILQISGGGGEIPDNYYNVDSIDDFRYLFCYGSRMEMFSLMNQDLTNVSNFSYAFSGSGSSLTSEKRIYEFTKNIKPVNTSNMFSDCNVLDKAINIDYSKINNASYMFYNCASLVSLDTVINLATDPSITSTVNVGSMFNGCKNLQEILNFNALKVSNFSRTFPYGHSEQSRVKFKRLTFSNANFQFDNNQKSFNIINCSFTKENLIEMFNSLPITGYTNTITITGNPGSLSLTEEDQLIAILKGWTLTL